MNLHSSHYSRFSLLAKSEMGENLGYRGAAKYGIIVVMRAEQIPSGVKDFKRIRLEGFYYVDKTTYIRKLEESARFQFFAHDLQRRA